MYGGMLVTCVIMFLTVKYLTWESENFPLQNKLSNTFMPAGIDSSHWSTHAALQEGLIDWIGW